MAGVRQALAECEAEARAERTRDSELQLMQRGEVEERMLKMASVRGEGGEQGIKMRRGLDWLGWEETAPVCGFIKGYLQASAIDVTCLSFSRAYTLSVSTPFLPPLHRKMQQ